MNKNNDFRKYATKHLGMNGLALEQYADVSANYHFAIILEERQLNVTQMDVFLPFDDGQNYLYGYSSG